MPDTPVADRDGGPYDPSVERRVTRLEEDGRQVNAAIAGLEMKVDRLETKVDRIETVVDRLDGAVQRLELGFVRLEIMLRLGGGRQIHPDVFGLVQLQADNHEGRQQKEQQVRQDVHQRRQVEGDVGHAPTATTSHAPSPAAQNILLAMPGSEASTSGE